MSDEVHLILKPSDPSDSRKELPEVSIHLSKSGADCSGTLAFPGEADAQTFQIPQGIQPVTLNRGAFTIMPFRWRVRTEKDWLNLSLGDGLREWGVDIRAYVIANALIYELKTSGVWRIVAHMK